MIRVLRWVVLSTASFGLYAQEAGVSSVWDTRAMLTTLTSQTQRLTPVLDKVQPANWNAQGASGAYVTQYKRVQSELKALTDVAAQLARQPEKLTVALDAYFRLQTLESNLDSLSEGVRKYQNPALADLMQGIVAENSVQRDRLRQYVTDLATTQEQELSIANQEAQRCRSSITKQPIAPARKGERK